MIDLISYATESFEAIHPLSLFTGVISGIVTTVGAAHLNARREQRREIETLKRRYKFPLLQCLKELENRLDKILSFAEHEWLSAKVITEVRKGQLFASNPNQIGYFAISTTYHIAKYFSLIEIISRETSYIEAPKTRQWREFSRIVDDIGFAWQRKELFDDCDFLRPTSPAKHWRDSWKLHRQLQHAIGEALIVSEGGKLRTMSFREFFQKYTKDPDFRFWCLGIEEYFVDMKRNIRTSVIDDTSAQNDARIARLAVLQYLYAKLINNISETFGINSTKSAAQLISRAHPDLRSAVRRLETRER